MYEEFTNAIGYSVIFTDDGVYCVLGKKSTVVGNDKYFPYGSIKKIKVGGLLGTFDIIGTRRAGEVGFTFPTNNKEQRKKIQEFIDFAQKKMKTAPPADAVIMNFWHPHQDAERFYEECNKANLCLTENSSKADIERAKLVAERHQLKVPEDKVVETYALGEYEIARIALNDYYENLFNQAKESEKYASYHGRDKEVFLAQEMVDFYNAKYMNMAMGKALPTQKEHDWALLGGIASGIAGGAAGIAVAADYQRKNEAIRAYNQQLRSNYVKAILPSLTEVMNDLDNWRKKLEKAKIALVDSSSSDKLFESIKFGEAQAHVLDNRSVVVTVEAKTPIVKIHDTVNAHIDGTLVAIVSQNGTVIGKAKLIIPNKGQPSTVNGKKYTKYVLVGACSGKADKDLNCEVEIICRDLWAIER